MQLFPWSVFGYAADPCPNGSLTFGSSVDSAAIQTKKSNLIECPAADEPTNDAGDQPTDDAERWFSATAVVARPNLVNL